MVQAQEFKVVQGLVADLHAGGREDQARALEKVLDLAASVVDSRRVPLRPREYLTTGQAAAALGVSRQSIENWVAAGRLRGVDLGGRTLLHRDEVEAQLDHLLSARPPSPLASPDERIEKWHDAAVRAVRAVPAGQLARLEALHARMEHGEKLSREERAEVAVLERTVTRAASDALERRVRDRHAPSA